MGTPESAPRWLLPAIAAATVAAFLPALSCGFVNWDDEVNFVDNPYYRGLAPRNLEWMFTTFHMGHYQPLAWVTLGLDYLVWGMNPFGYHLTSLLLHVAAAMVFYAVALALTRSWPAAAAASLFFALHPLRVESVVWVTERRDVLCGLFFLLTVLFYLKTARAREEGRPWRRTYAASIVFFALSLLSKSLGIMLPVVLLILDACPLGRWRAGARGRLLLEKAPFFLLLAADAIVTLAAMGEIKAVRGIEGYAAGERIMQAAYGLCFYVGKTAVPLGLSPLYPLERPMNPWALRYLLGAAAVILAGILLARVRRRWPALPAAALAYAALLAPVLGLAVTGRQLVADRYSYLACLPWALLAGAGLAAWGRPAARRIAAAGAGVLLGVLTFLQAGIWTDSAALWDHALALDSSNATAWANRGLARSLAGDLAGGIEDFDRAIRLDPSEGNVFRNRGINRRALRDFDGAGADFEESLRRAPDQAKTYLARGDLRRVRGDLHGALADFARAVELEPWNASAYSARAIGRSELGRIPEAMADFEEAFRLGPPTAEALSIRASVRLRREDFAGAVADATEALRLDPRHAGAYVNRGLGLKNLGNLAGARADLDRALERAPNLAAAWVNRAGIRAEQGDLPGAIADCTEALRISPRLGAALINRGLLRRRAGDEPGAVADLRAALEGLPPGPDRQRIEDLLKGP